MNLDFIWRINDHINTLNLFAVSYVGNLDVDSNIGVLAVPGGISQTYYDGTRDQDYNIQVSVKSDKQQECVEALNAVMDDFITLNVLNSNNNSFDFNRIVVENPPSFVTQLETGEFIYELQCTAKITIFRGAM